MDLESRRRYFNLCDDTPLDPDDPRNVDLSHFEGGVARSGHVLDGIAAALELSDRPVTQFFVAQRGSGVTTELWRLANRLADPAGACLVPIYVPGAAIVDRFGDMGWHELSGFVVDAIGDALGEGLPQADPSMPSDLRIDWQLEYLDSIARTKLPHARRGIVVLVDTPPSTARKRATAQYFYTAAQQRRLPVHFVYAIPCEFIPQLDEAGLLPMIMVRTREGRSFPAGLAAIREIIERRIPVSALEEIFGGDWQMWLSKLALWSGGSPRDLLALLRSLLSLERYPVTAAEAEHIFAEFVSRFHRTMERDWYIEFAKIRETPPPDILARGDVRFYASNRADGFYDLSPALYRQLNLDHTHPNGESKSSGAPRTQPNSTANGLNRLILRDIGPIEQLDVEFAPRVNVIVGDNGLGKTFVLSVAWWVLTGSWAGSAAWPSRDERLRKPQIKIQTESGQRAISPFDIKRETWPRPTDWPVMQGPVVYARVDGGVSVWDPLRHDLYGIDDPRSRPALHFSASELETGLTDKLDGTSRCNGLLEDWEHWRHNDLALFEVFFAVVRTLFEYDDGSSEAPTPGPATQLSKSDERLIPTLDFSYGRVPVTHLSAGMRRILGLAYALTWSWSGHRRAAEIEGHAPATRIVLLFDELESHLHPRWQRLLLPALLQAISLLDEHVAVQLIATTHSPLILASLTGLFDPSQDRMWQLETQAGKIWMDDLPWANFGDATGWLTSPLFGLSEATSLPAQRALNAANALLRGEPSNDPDLATQDQIEAALRQTVVNEHPIWLRWTRVFGEVVA